VGRDKGEKGGSSKRDIAIVNRRIVNRRIVNRSVCEAARLGQFTI
jgi:hypothetical protein